MVDQAQVVDRSAASPTREAARSVSELLHDVLLLAELQGQLLAAEVQGEVKQSVPPLIGMAIGAVLGASCIPLALVCAALWLDEATALSTAESFLAVLLGGIVLAGVIVIACIGYLRRTFHLLARSRAEFQMNVRWVRSAIRRLGSAGAKSGS